LNDLVFRPFNKQIPVLTSEKNIIGAFAGKRGGKTEVGAVKSALFQEQKPNKEFFSSGIDPYLGIIIAPTTDMLRRLSMKKFLAYARPFINDINQDYNKSTFELTWHDGSMVYGISADKPQRLEGVKAAWIWIDEVFQCKEEIYLEALARIADSDGYVICTGSLGVQYINPKLHWAHRYFKEQPDSDTICFEWKSSDNPYFPTKTLERARSNLDPKTYRAMFEIDWDTIPQSAVYSDLDADNFIKNYKYNPHLHTYISIDWGYAHPMAVLFIQYDPTTDRVFVFDEIVESKIKIFDGTLMRRIQNKMSAHGIDHVDGWVCDIAGNQEREQTGKSNITFFEETYSIYFKKRRTAIQYGIPLVRSYIRDGMGRTRLFFDEVNCPKTIDQHKMYRYPEKDGMIQNENPIKENDDSCDALRYFVVNILDKTLHTNTTSIGRMF